MTVRELIAALEKIENKDIFLLADEGQNRYFEPCDIEVRKNLDGQDVYVLITRPQGD